MTKDLNLEECIEKALSGRDQFSLSEEFNLEYDDINAVTLITPTQTISCFADYKKNKFGSGNHNLKFEEILYAIYEEKSEGFNSHQDIKIGYVNFDYDPFPVCQIVIFLPPIITSSQFKSLCNLNEEVIKLQRKNNNMIKMYISDEEKTLGRKLLDISDILIQIKENKISHCLIDDNYQFKYQEKHMVGYPNEENHYNTSTFIVKDTFNKVK